MCFHAPLGAEFIEGKARCSVNSLLLGHGLPTLDSYVDVSGFELVVGSEPAGTAAEPAGRIAHREAAPVANRTDARRAGGRTGLPPSLHSVRTPPSDALVQHDRAASE